MKKNKKKLGFLGLFGLFGFLGYLPNLSGLFSLFTLFSLFGFFWMPESNSGFKDFFNRKRVLNSKIYLGIAFLTLLLAYLLNLKVGSSQSFFTAFFSLFFSLLIILESYVRSKF